MRSTLLVIGMAALCSGCATSLTPSQFGDSFPRATSTRFYERPAANEAISNGECKILVENRKYVAPIGLTVNGDVKNGAVGVDEWVDADKGNAYTLNNFEWISVPIGADYATQLVLYFDTLLCE